MTIDELLNELTFHGSQCTKDCSGHRAGWAWATKYPNRPTTNRATHISFNNGVDIRNAHSKMITPAIRGAKGRFVKFEPTPKTSKKKPTI